MKLINMANFGPVARYTDAHLFVAMDILSRNGCCSRRVLAEEMDLGEGSIRSMLKVMKEWGWIDVRRPGVSMSATGRANFEDFGIRFVDIGSPAYGAKGHQQAILVKGAADTVTSGMAQRDMAVSNGAYGASVFVMRGGRIFFPDSWDVDDNDPDFAATIRSAGMEDGDVLVIVYSDSRNRARVIAASVGLAMR